MKALTLLLMVFLLSIILVIDVRSTFCCQTEPYSGQKRCYTEGVCCNEGQPSEYHAGSCYDFQVSVSGPSYLTVGVKTQINLYIHNIGSFDDSYTIKNILYEGISSDHISVSFPTDPINVRSGVREQVPIYVTLLYSNAAGNVIFPITNSQGQTKEAIYTVNGGENLFSLPEFVNLLILILILFSTALFIKFRKLN